eukprot:COSAG06_NODE_29671_length_552_cov_0.858720_2_plen_111_part_01
MRLGGATAHDVRRVTLSHCLSVTAHREGSQPEFDGEHNLGQFDDEQEAARAFDTEGTAGVRHQNRKMIAMSMLSFVRVLCPPRPPLGAPAAHPRTPMCQLRHAGARCRREY